jgi:hypothetical protein
MRYKPFTTPTGELVSTGSFIDARGLLALQLMDKMTPTTLKSANAAVMVTRACDLAAAMFAEMEARGFVHEAKNPFEPAAGDGR